MKKGDIAPEDIPSYAETLDEFQCWLDFYDNQDIRQLQQEFDYQVKSLRPRISVDLDTALENDSISEATKRLKQMEAI